MCYCNGYSGLAIADYFIEKALADGKKITNMHVLKMIYFAHAYSFGVLKRMLIKDDFYVWRFGPVEVKTYKEFKKYEANAITQISGKSQSELENIKNNSEISAFLNRMYDMMIDANTYRLSELSHIVGGPWYITPMYQIIDPSKIASFYGKQ